jgi:aerobic carbon-monoxide dehydrogenase small subunit
LPRVTREIFGEDSPMEKTISFTLNGEPKSVTTDPERPLLEVLREDLHATGTKYGCGEGRCGSCTVLVGGRAAFSCTTPIAEAEGQSVRTIEGLAEGGKLHPVQEAFLEEGACQCGFCTPGMIVAAAALLEEKPHPTAAEIRAGMEKHLCRCCGYPKIEKAITRAAAGPATNK